MIALLALLALFLGFPESREWIVSDPINRAVTALALLMGVVLTALYRAAKELHRLKVEVEPVLSTVRDLPDGGQALYLALIVRIRNDSEADYRVRFPDLRLWSRRRRWNRWKPSGRILHTIARSISQDEYDPNEKHWDRKRLHLPARDEVEQYLHLTYWPKRKGDTFRGTEKKLRMTLVILGHADVVRELDFPESFQDGVAIGPVAEDAIKQ